MVDRDENELTEARVFFFCFPHPILPLFKFELCKGKIDDFDDFAVEKLAILNSAEKGVDILLIASRS